MTGRAAVAALLRAAKDSGATRGPPCAPSSRVRRAPPAARPRRIDARHRRQPLGAASPLTPPCPSPGVARQNLVHRGESDRPAQGRGRRHGHQAGAVRGRGGGTREHGGGGALRRRPPGAKAPACAAGAGQWGERAALANGARAPMKKKPAGTTGARRARRRPGTPPPPPPPHASPRQCSMIAFCACMRFSASWNTTERADSTTASVVSTPRSAGRQCWNQACGPAAAIIASST